MTLIGNTPLMESVNTSKAKSNETFIELEGTIREEALKTAARNMMVMWTKIVRHGDLQGGIGWL
jgi:hypothetical protein